MWTKKLVKCPWCLRMHVFWVTSVPWKHYWLVIIKTLPYFVHPGHGRLFFNSFHNLTSPYIMLSNSSQTFFQCHQPWSGLYNNLHVKKQANTKGPVKMMCYYSGWRSACGEELGFNLIFLIIVSIKTSKH